MNITDFKTKHAELIANAKERISYNESRGGYGITIDGTLLSEIIELLDTEE